MNRDFLVRSITPAKARMMVMAARCANLHLSRDIIAMAGEGLLDRAAYGDLSDQQLEIAQFISDYNHRCLIPHDEYNGFDEEVVLSAVRAMLPKDRPVLFINTTPALTRLMHEPVTMFSESNTDRCQYISFGKIAPSEMVRVRGRYVVACVTQQHVGYEWLGRLFPEMVIYCRDERQSQLPLGGMMSPYQNVIEHAASIIYPEAVKAVKHSSGMHKRFNAHYPMFGCYPGLLRKTNNRNTSGPKNISPEFENHLRIK